ncbi:insulinase family protein [Ideonella sp. TBM-1]|uniref:Insulinase family protein n=1 Tax=Ideonella livida TaxID=2707176 RepID=A0A7C9PKJ8_9BURK|nr:insulinase family protein [Ideonella livida]
MRLVGLPLPWRQTVALSVFVRTGSLHESTRENGISHVVEHMAFKGTPTRNCQQLNLEAERLGAEVNAHTDKDHTAFHLEGLPQDLPAFVDLLADIVLHGTFPEDELERERQVILHELTEVQEDPAAMAFQAFDRACYGPQHPAGRPIIGQRRNIERFTRAELQRYVARQYGAGHTVLAVAGPLNARQWKAFERDVASAFGDMPTGQAPQVQAPAWHGGLKVQRLAGSSQCQVVLGFEAPALADEARGAPVAADVLAAALLGEGMSSPLLDEIRERRGLAYYVACSADVLPLTGQFIIEAATGAKEAPEYLQAVAELLARLAQDGPAAVDLERARRQLWVRALRGLEAPARRLEAAVQDLFIFGRLRDPLQGLQRLQEVDARQVQDVFQRLLSGRAAIALAGSVPQKVRDQATVRFRLS